MRARRDSGRRAASTGVRARAGCALIIALAVLRATPAAAQGVTLDHYRAAETPRDGFVVTRPRTLGHLGFSASLHVDYALEPLRGPASAARAVLVDHELEGQVGGAIGLFGHVVFALRLPVVLYMGGPAAAAGAPTTRDPGASGTGVGDLALSVRVQLTGDDDDVFALALQTEATIPLAEAASSRQDLAGEAGVSFTPELAAELRFMPVRITANLGARFREAAAYQTLRVQHELTWALAVGVDIVPDVFDATLEGFGSAALDRFTNSALAPIEVLLGLRVRPVTPLFLGLAGGLGLGEGYGAPAFRGVFTVGFAEVGPMPEPDARDPVEVAPDVEPLEVIDAADVDAPDELAAAPSVDAPPPSASRVAPPEPGDYGQLDRDGDRIVDAEDGCVLDREDYDEILDADGCPETDADDDHVADVEDRCPLTPGLATEDPDTRGCPGRAYVSDGGSIVITDRVEFLTGSDRILPASEPVLTDVLSILSSSPDVLRVRIEGHTDDRGRDSANLTLSRARAASVRRWLVERGIAVERLEAWGCGELHPLLPGHRRPARQANRRVEFFVVDPMSPDLTLRERCEAAVP